MPKSSSLPPSNNVLAIELSAGIAIKYSQNALQKIKNPLNDKEIYQIEGDVVGFKDIKLEPKKEFAMDAEMLELFNLFKK